MNQKSKNDSPIHIPDTSLDEFKLVFYGTETLLEFDDELDKDKPLPPVNQQDVSQDNTAIGARQNVMVDTEGGPWTGSQQVERVSHPEVQRPTTENQTSGCSGIDTGNGRCLGGCLILLLLAYLLGGASLGNLATSWQNFISVGNESDLETMSCQRTACLDASLPIDRPSSGAVSCSWWRLRPIDIFIWIRSRAAVIVYRRSFRFRTALCNLWLTGRQLLTILPSSPLLLIETFHGGRGPKDAPNIGCLKLKIVHVSVHVIPILGVGLVQSNVVYERLYIHRNSCSVEREKSSVMATPSMALGTIIVAIEYAGKSIPQSMTVLLLNMQKASWFFSPMNYSKWESSMRVSLRERVSKNNDFDACEERNSSFHYSSRRLIIASENFKREFVPIARSIFSCARSSENNYFLSTCHVRHEVLINETETSRRHFSTWFKGAKLAKLPYYGDSRWIVSMADRSWLNYLA